MSHGSAAGNFIFVRVPRTGSTTLLNYLTEEFTDLEARGYTHLSALRVRDLWPDEWENRHTFGTIRNPWEWLVSFYNAGISVSPDPDIKEAWSGNPIQPPDMPGIHPGQRGNLSFPDWVRQRQTTPCDWLFDGSKKLVDEVRRFEDVVPAFPLSSSAYPHAPYREWHDDDLAAYVADKCWREIEIGGYTF